MYWNKLIPELSVSNLENSLNFYKTAGFNLEYERPENKFAFISLGEIQFMLQELTASDKWDIGKLTYPFGNGINFQLEIENILDETINISIISKLLNLNLITETQFYILKEKIKNFY